MTGSNIEVQRQAARSAPCGAPTEADGSRSNTNVRAARLQRPIVLNAKALIPCNTLVLGSGDMAGIILAIPLTRT